MAVSVTFMSGVVVGWLLNTYTRKVGKGCSSRATHTASALVTMLLAHLPHHSCPDLQCQSTCLTPPLALCFLVLLCRAWTSFCQTCSQRSRACELLMHALLHVRQLDQHVGHAASSLGGF